MILFCDNLIENSIPPARVIDRMWTCKECIWETVIDTVIVFFMIYIILNVI